MAQRTWLAWQLSLLLGTAGCGSPPPVAGPARRTQSATPPKAPIPEQTNYCSRLQPLLDQAVKTAEVGTPMHCLDLPGVTELGRYGPPNAAEEDTLVNCFDSEAAYAELLERPNSSFQLVIDDAFVADTEVGGSVGLPSLIPWLPSVSASSGDQQRVSATVTINNAHFVTLVGVATKLQGEQREEACLHALCSAEYSYVHKALLGTPTVLLRADNQRRQAVSVDTGPLGANFKQDKLAGGATQITSTKPVTLAIARASFRTPQTERLCQFCGRQAQSCCSASPSCDGGLGCVDGQCVAVGGPKQPCDQLHCTQGAACVGGTCQVECGGQDQPCCGERTCSSGLHCIPNPRNQAETLVLSQRVSVDAGLFGTDEDRTLGRSSCANLGRSRFAVSKVGSGRGDCERAWWFDPQNARDCRVGVHFNVSTFGSIECQLDVYATPPPQPDVCAR